MSSPTGLYLLFSSGVDADGLAAGRLAPAGIAVLLGFLALLGLRDKVSFLGARPEIYATMLAVGLFPVSQWIVAWQFVFIFIWWGAASSKLNRHFPFVVSVMISNAPLVGPKALKRKLWRDYPEDMRPSQLAAAHRPLRHRAGVRLAAAPADRRQRHRPHDRDRRDDPLPPQHHLDVPAWRCRWSGTSS